MKRSLPDEVIDRVNEVIEDRYKGDKDTFVVIDECFESKNEDDKQIYITYTVYSPKTPRELNYRFWGLTHNVRRALGPVWAERFPFFEVKYKDLSEMPDEICELLEVDRDELISRNSRSPQIL